MISLKSILTNDTLQKIILIVVIIILLLMWKDTYDTKQIEKKLYSQNIKAIASTSKSYIDELDSLLTTERLAFLGQVEGLKEYNQELNDKIESLEESGKIVFTGSTTDLSINGFSGKKDKSLVDIINEKDYKISWVFQDSGDGWLKVLEGQSMFTISPDSKPLSNVYTEITKDSLSFIIDTYFVMNEDGSYSALAKSSYPGMLMRTSGVLYPEKILEEIPVIPSPNKISLGIQTGIGIDPFRIGNPDDTPMVGYIGIGIQYELASILTW